MTEPEDELPPSKRRLARASAVAALAARAAPRSPRRPPWRSPPSTAGRRSLRLWGHAVFVEREDGLHAIANRIRHFDVAVFFGRSGDDVKGMLSGGDAGGDGDDVPSDPSCDRSSPSALSLASASTSVSSFRLMGLQRNWLIVPCGNPFDQAAFRPGRAPRRELLSIDGRSW